ncbi:Galactosyl T domain containing protein, partial [Asbolus verrucosus]
DNVSFFFLLGEIRNNSLLQSKVELESKHFDDIIQERFIDHYNNLTLKSVNMLKLFNSHCSKSYKYLMKIDDDVFLNIDLVMEMLLQRKSATDVLVGKIINDTGPFRETGNKWYVPYEWYPEAKYPDYLCGPTYLMSADVVRKLYHCALETPIFYIEDVYVTGICAKKMGIVPKHDRLFTCHHLDMNFCHNRNLYSLHFRTPEDIRNSYRILKNNECPARIGWRVGRVRRVILVFVYSRETETVE